MKRSNQSPVPAFLIGLLIILFTSGAFSVLLNTPPPNVVQAQACWHVMGDWVEIASIPQARIEAMTTVADGKIYVMGGFYNSTWAAGNRVHVYDPTTNQWAQLANLPIILTHAGIAVDGNNIWVVGGFNNYPVTDAVYVYDITEDEWRAGPTLPEQIGSASLARIGRFLHYFGGVESDRQTDRDEHWILNLDDEASGWKSHTTINRPRNHMSVAVVDGLVYALGGMLGHNGGPELDVDYIDVYDPVTNTWSEHGTVNRDRSHFEPGTSVSNGRIIAVGGRDQSTRLNEVSEYNPLTDEWHHLGNVPMTNVGGVGQVVSGYLYAGTGREWNDSMWRAQLTYICDQPATLTSTPTVTETGTRLWVDTNTPTATATTTGTIIPTPTTTATPTNTPTATLTSTITDTPTNTPTPTITMTPTHTSTPVTLLPDRPTGLANSGNLTSIPVDVAYHWNHDGKALWYHLYATNNVGYVLDLWFDASIICTNICTGNPTDLVPANGDYQWWVVGWNDYGLGEWSLSDTFTVNVPTPVQPIGLTTNGSLTQPSIAPSLEWTQDVNTQWYNVIVNYGGGQVFNQWYDASVVCNSICRVTPDTITYQNGDYTWTVQGWSAYGDMGVLSAVDSMRIAVADSLPTGLTVNLITNPIPISAQLQWSYDSVSEWFQVWVGDSNNANNVILNGWYSATDTNCNITCTLDTSGYTNGNYKWWISGWNLVTGQGAWVSTNFTVDVPLPTTPNMQVGDDNTSLVYDYDTVSEWYEVYVSTIDNSTILVNQWYSASDLGCSTTCTLDGLTFANGDYHWWIHGWNSANGSGAWASLNFSINVP